MKIIVTDPGVHGSTLFVNTTTKYYKFIPHYNKDSFYNAQGLYDELCNDSDYNIWYYEDVRKIPGTHAVTNKKQLLVQINAISMLNQNVGQIMTLADLFSITTKNVHPTSWESWYKRQGHNIPSGHANYSKRKSYYAKLFLDIHQFKHIHQNKITIAKDFSDTWAIFCYIKNNTGKLLINGV